jgi:hypothetical protein
MPMNSIELEQCQRQIDDLRRKLRRPINDHEDTQKLFVEIVEALHHVVRIIDRMSRQ